MSKLETNTIDTVSGTTNLTIGSTNTSTITMPSGATSGQNYPGFHVFLDADQTVSDVTATKIAFDTVTYDSASCWDATNYRWTPNKSGKYMIYGQAYCTGSTNTVDRAYVYLYLNSSTTVTLQQLYGNSVEEGTVWSPSFQIVYELNGTTDYIEMWGLIDVASGTPRFDANVGQHRCCFGAYRLGA